jgi:hypothetical protein
MRYRKVITTSVGFCFVVVGITGVIFKLWFKNHALEEIHGWLGLALISAASLHIFQNWGSLRRHLRDKRIYALLLPVALVCGVFALQREPPRGMSSRRVIRKLTEASPADVAKVFGKDLNQVFASMKSDGLSTEAATTLQQLADRNKQPPEKILDYFAM